ncbi:MAG: putative adhesin [Bacteroidota bacterium]
MKKNIKNRKIYLLETERKNIDRLERLLAINNPTILALAESTASLMDGAANKEGRITNESMINTIKTKDNLTVAATLKKEFGEEKLTVKDVIETIHKQIVEFWGAELNVVQQEMLMTFVDNILLNLGEQKDFSWISFLEKGKKSTEYQYNLFLASDPPEGSFFCYSVPFVVTLAIDLPTEKIYELEKEDTIKVAIKMEGIKIGQLANMEMVNNRFKGFNGKQDKVLPGVIVSAHGGRWNNQKADLKVPQGSNCMYFVPDDTILTDNEGRLVLSSLSKNTMPKTPFQQLVKGGEFTYDYECWFAKDWPSECGIFDVGTGELLMSLSKYTEQNPLKLSTILEIFPDKTIYWDACRTASDPDRFAYHSVPKDAYLSVSVRQSLQVENITNITVHSGAGTQVLTGTNGEYNTDKSVLWVKQVGSNTFNGGPIMNVSYKISFTGKGSPVSLKFKGRFAGVGYEFGSK